jgi:hypothetical protein
MESHSQAGAINLRGQGSLIHLIYRSSYSDPFDPPLIRPEIMHFVLASRSQCHFRLLANIMSQGI